MNQDMRHCSWTAKCNIEAQKLIFISMSTNTEIHTYIHIYIHINHLLNKC